MAMKKHKLNVAIEEDFCLLGIVTDEPDFKLCWLINQSLGMIQQGQVDDLTLLTLLRTLQLTFIRHGSPATATQERVKTPS